MTTPTADAFPAPDPQFNWDLLLGRLLNLGEKTDSISGHIALVIAREIIEGRLPAGFDLNSIELARRFESSRTPVREALFLLESEGLVAIQARRRPRVIEHSAEQVAEIYNLRGHLYALVSERVAVTASPAQIDILDGHLETMRNAAQAGDVDTFFWSNVLFHEQCATFAEAATLKRSLDGLGVQVLQLRHASMSIPGRMMLSLSDHERLVRAYRERDSELAAALSKSIITSALKALGPRLPASTMSNATLSVPHF